MVVIFTLMLLFSLAPFFLNSEKILKPLQFCYSFICHQHECASFSIGESSALVCYRCQAGYLGIIAAGMAILFIKGFAEYIDRKLSLRLIITTWVACWILILADVQMKEMGVISHLTARRLLSGFLLGGATVILLFKAFLIYLKILDDQRNP